MVNSICVAYFSPTGGTERAARLLAQEFGLPVSYLDLTRPENREKRRIIAEDTLLIAACPVYMGQLPIVEGLFENLAGEGTPCVVMASYGNREYENLLAQLGAKLAGQGFVCVGGIACIIPHCYMEEMGAGRPDGEDLPAFSDFAQAVLSKLAQPSYAAAELPGEKEPGRRERRPIARTWDEETCTRCGLCVQECPTAAIDPESMAVDQKLCVVCVKCEQICPAGAMRFDKSHMRAFLSQHLERNPVEWFC